MPADTQLEHLNDELRAMLARRRKSQADLSDLLGVTQTQVSARLRGDIEWRITELWRVADWLGTTLPALLFAAAENATAVPTGATP